MPLGLEHLRLRDRAASVLELSGLGELVRRIGAWRGLLVLNYHQIANDPATLVDPSLWSATQAQLEEQLSFLARHVDLVGPAALQAGPGRRAQVLLTFDDGYRDNHDLALPVLKQHGAPAVFFVTSGFIDEPRLPWWGELQAMLATSPRATVSSERWLGHDIQLTLDGSRGPLEHLRGIYESVSVDDKEILLTDLAQALAVPRSADAGDSWMTWDMVRALRDAGMTVGGHTLQHPRLADLDAQGQAQEINGGLERLEAELGERATLFSYPYGDRAAFDQRSVAALRDAGIQFAFSYYGGYNTARSWQPYDLRRVSAAATTSRARSHAIVTIPRLFAKW